MKTEIYISVKDLIKECIRKIWVIIVAMIVFAVLLTGAKYAKDKKAAGSTGEQTNEKQTVESVTKDLSKTDYDSAMSYADMTEFRDMIKQYTANAKLMKINPYSADTAELQYFVDGPDGQTRKDMVTAYLAYISEGALADDVVKELGTDNTASEIQELINCDATGSVNTSYYMENTNVINISVYGDSADDCSETTDAVKKCIDSYSQSLQDVAAHSLSLFKENYSVTSSSYLIGIRNDRFGMLTNYNGRVTDYENYLTDEQISNGKKVADIQKSEDTEDTQVGDEQENNDIKVSISKKYFVVGAFLGLVIAIIIIVLRYMFDPTIKNEKDLQMFYNADFIGKAEEGRCALAASKIISICNGQNISKVLLAGDVSDKQRKVLEEIVAAVEKKNITAELIGNILEDAAAVEKIGPESAVVLLETVRQSKYDDFNQEKAVCNSVKAKLIGYIALNR